MVDWKVICLFGLFNGVLAFILSLIYFPLIVLGPFIGGFLASYFSKSYEDYAAMDLSDGAVVGVISGIIGGLILTVLLIWGMGAVSYFTGLISTGTKLTGIILAGYIVFQLSVILSMVVGVVGGIVGFIVKNKL